MQYMLLYKKHKNNNNDNINSNKTIIIIVFIVIIIKWNVTLFSPSFKTRLGDGSWHSVM